MREFPRLSLLAAATALACGVTAAEPAVSRAKAAPPAEAPPLAQIRNVEIQGVSDVPVRLKNGRYEGPPAVPGAAERPRVDLLGSWTATGPLDFGPLPYRIVLVAASAGGTGTRVHLAVFGWRDGRVANVATVALEDRVQPRGVSLDGRLIVVDVYEHGPKDPLCCPTQPGRRTYELNPEGLVEIPDVGFTFIRSQIVLPVTVGTVAGLHVLLDTGTDPSIVDLEMAARLGLPADMETAASVEGVGNAPIAAHPSQIRGLKLGGLDVPPIEAVAMDLSDASRRLGVEIAGILGRSFLRGRIVQIDYPLRRLRVYPEPPPVPPSALVLPLRIAEEHHAPLLAEAVKVNGKSIAVTLDTGSSAGLQLFPSAREILGNDLWQGSARIGHEFGPGGETLVRHVTAGSIWLGPFPIDSHDLVLTDRGDERGHRQGNLGNGVLDSFIVTLDDRSGQVIFSRP